MTDTIKPTKKQVDTDLSVRVYRSKRSKGVLKVVKCRDGCGNKLRIYEIAGVLEINGVAATKEEWLLVIFPDHDANGPYGGHMPVDTASTVSSAKLFTATAGSRP